MARAATAILGALLVANCHWIASADTPPTNGLGLTFLENLAWGQNTSASCKAALAKYPRTSDTAKRALFASGKITQAWELFLPILLALDPAQKAKPEGRTDLVTKVMAESWMPEDEGQADRCYYLPGFHYCQLYLLPATMMLGACVPKECSYQEVADSVMPQFIQSLSGAFGLCGRASYPWTPFRIFAVLLTVILVMLVLGATAKEMWEYHKEVKATIKAQRASEEEKTSSYLGPNVRMGSRGGRQGSRIRGRLTKEYSSVSDPEKPPAMDAPKASALGRAPSSLGRALTRTPASKAGMSQIRPSSRRLDHARSASSHPPAPVPVPMRWKLLNCFSLNRNWTLLFAPVRNGDYNFFDGYRSLSMTYVILVHVLSWPASQIVYENYKEFSIGFDGNKGAMQTFPGQAFHGAEYSVDTFFFMSTFLLVFHVCRYLKANPNLKRFLFSIPLLWIKRLIRLCPLFYYVYIMYWQLGPVMINGTSLYAYSDVRFQDCTKNWWQDLLFIRNLIAPDTKTNPLAGTTVCLGQIWYLNTDTQIFFVTPLLALLAFYRPKAGLGFMASLCVASYIGMTLLGNKYNWSVSFLDSKNFATNYFLHAYQKPWARAPAAFIGGMTAIVHLEYPQVTLGLSTHRKLGLAVFLGAVAIMALSVYGPMSAQYLPCPWSQTAQSLWLAVAPSFWSFSIGALTLVFTATPPGFGVVGWVRKFLELYVFTVLGRLTFSIYLIHGPLINLWMAYFTHPIEFSAVSFTISYLGIVFASVVCGLGVFMLVEKPFANINWEFDQQAARRKAEAKRKAKDLERQELSEIEMGKGSQTGSHHKQLANDYLTSPSAVRKPSSANKVA